MAAKPISPHGVEAAKDNDYGATPMDVFHCATVRDANVCLGPRGKIVPAIWIESMA